MYLDIQGLDIETRVYDKNNSINALYEFARQYTPKGFLDINLCISLHPQL